MPKGPRKTTGEIGSTIITQTERGMTAELNSVMLPADKEGLERYFAERFVEQFNADRPLGPDVLISNLTQNGTADLDFSVSSSFADYLELAELNPQSEAFGRAALRTGKLNVYEYAKWIFFRVIKSKARKYGEVASRTVLLLFVTHWQFYPSDRVIECLNSLVVHNGCTFAAVFVLMTNGSDLRLLKPVHPYSGPHPRRPRDYEGFTLTNLPPGHHSWALEG
jgi:hypothetical protein